MSSNSGSNGDGHSLNVASQGPPGFSVRSRSQVSQRHSLSLQSMLNACLQGWQIAGTTAESAAACKCLSEGQH